MKSHAQELANHAGRPFEYLTSHTRMQQRAHELAERDNLNAGLVCVFSVLEPCRTFPFQSTQGRPFVKPARRKCLLLYDYFIDPRFGLLHVKIQTWFPMAIQIYLNVHSDNQGENSATIKMRKPSRWATGAGRA